MKNFYNLALEDIVLQQFKVLKFGQFAIFRPEIMILTEVAISMQRLHQL